MKTKIILRRILLVIFPSLLLFACESEDGSIVASKIKTLISVGSEDGYIENQTNRIVLDYYNHTQGKSLCIGWTDAGYTMRGFLSFNATEIMPNAGYELIIDEAVLSVYESNTNLHPFDASGTRVVDCFLVPYGTLNKNDYDLNPFAHCGTIATWGYNVLKEHSLTVTSVLNNFVKANPEINRFQFRMQFVPDGNVQPPSPLTNCMWLIFSGDETSRKDYRPKLTIKYHYKKI